MLVGIDRVDTDRYDALHDMFVCRINLNKHESSRRCTIIPIEAAGDGEKGLSGEESRSDVTP